MIKGSIFVAGLFAMGPAVVPHPPEDAPVETRLWPSGAPDEPEGLVAPESTSDVGQDGILRIRFVETPTMTVYHAPEEGDTGAAVVVLPGGGYNLLAWSHEGTDVAQWLNGLGITAVVVKYRVPRRDGQRPHPWPLQDAQRAMRLTRSRAEAWGIDPNRVGLMGFSAGGHLSVATATAEETKLGYPRVDEADDLSARPDFLMPIYAAYLGDPDGPDGELRFPPEIQPSKSTPPTFMAVTFDDQQRGADAARLFVTLQGLGVSSEVHVFARGGHGYGLRDTGLPVNQWPGLCADWMRASGFLLGQSNR